MTYADAWQTLPKGMYHSFSPSGHAVAFHSFADSDKGDVEIQFADGCEPRHLGEPNTSWIGWASDNEVVYRAAIPPFGKGNGDLLSLYSLDNRTTRPVMKIESHAPLRPMRESGCFSWIGERDGSVGLFVLDIYRGTRERLSAFDRLFSEMKVGLAWSHDWSPDGQRLAIVAWPEDYWEEGTEADETNSQWRPAMDDPSLKEVVVIKGDGTRSTLWHEGQEARRRKPYRLFLIERTGEYEEVPHTYHALYPLWSSDGTMLVFQRREAAETSLWLLQVETRTQRRVGTCRLAAHPVMHPEGFLFCCLIDPQEKDWLKQMRGAVWKALRLSEGQVSPRR